MAITAPPATVHRRHLNVDALCCYASGMMNRQLRRAEKQKEERAEREKAKAQAEKRARREARKAAVKKRREALKAGRKEGGQDAKKPPEPGAPKRTNPGRFSGGLTAATVFFISLQAVAPPDVSLAGQVVSASFYLLFGYFATLWMMRRSAEQPIVVVVAASALMALVTLANQRYGLFLGDELPLQVAPLMLALAVPFAILGGYLGRLVWNRSP